MNSAAEPRLIIPAHLMPRDGRFGSGPAKVRREAMAALAASPLMGTSHRQPPVISLVAHIRAALAELYRLPDGYQVVLGNGGSTFFWDTAVCSLIEHRSAHGVNGQFSRKFALAAQRAPFLADPYLDEVPAGGAVLPTVRPDTDVYAWAHNETSTGAVTPVRRLTSGEALMLVDATSAAGGMTADIAATDVYYFAPQKNFSSDGGLWLAFCSPAALARAERLTATNRWMPDSLNLSLAARYCARNQTLNTPAIATLVLLADQLDWISAQGGLDVVAARCQESTGRIYRWADNHDLATPFVAQPEFRSPVVATIDFDPRLDAHQLTAQLRANGIVDVEPYRSLGRNQIRVGTYASVQPDDVSALLTCIDWLIERLVG